MLRLTTLFAPSNAAFAKLPEDDLNDLMAGKDVLTGDFYLSLVPRIALVHYNGRQWYYYSGGNLWHCIAIRWQSLASK